MSLKVEIQKSSITLKDMHDNDIAYIRFSEGPNAQIGIKITRIEDREIDIRID